MLAPDIRNICFIPAKPGMAALSSPPRVSAPSMASAICAATGSTNRCQTAIVCSIQSARLHADTVALTRGNVVTSSSHTSAIDAASVNARRWAESGVGSAPSDATVLRAVSLATAQFTPDPAAAGAPANMDPAPPSIAKAPCICCMNAFMSPPESEEKKDSNGFSLPAPDPPDEDMPPEAEPDPRPPPSTHPSEPDPDGFDPPPEDFSPGCDGSSG